MKRKSNGTSPNEEKKGVTTEVHLSRTISMDLEGVHKRGEKEVPWPRSQISNRTVSICVGVQRGKSIKWRKEGSGTEGGPSALKKERT